MGHCRLNTTFPVVFGEELGRASGSGSWRQPVWEPRMTKGPLGIMTAHFMVASRALRSEAVPAAAPLAVSTLAAVLYLVVTNV